MGIINIMKKEQGPYTGHWHNLKHRNVANTATRRGLCTTYGEKLKEENNEKSDEYIVINEK